MSRPGPHRDDLVDAVAGAVANLVIERTFDLPLLPRLIEANALAGTNVGLRLQFRQHADFVELQGDMSGRLVLTCQRCLQDVDVILEESPTLRLVPDEEGVPAESEHEYVVADPARLDVRWLAEEQALLAMPLVPMHEPDQCPQKVIDAEEEAEPGIAQTPFANLRDILKKG